MDALWAPWRMAYLKKKKEKKCIFCSASKNFNKTIFKTAHSLCMLNIYPYNNGHLMVAPIRHINEIGRLNDAQLLDLFKAAIKAKKLLDKVLKPHGYNVGMNIAKVSGAGITGHLHLHLVPRWHGDTNFMPVTGSTKVISQSLNELSKALKNELPE